MWICNECNHRFEEPKRKRICFEAEYGVASLFDSSHYTDVMVCESCGSRDIDELVECRNCGELVREEDLFDTDQIVNGGIGLVCRQCFRDMEE